MSRFSEKEISKQEALTPERLTRITAGYCNKENRPIGSLIEVIHWARQYVETITQQKDWIPFVHNKISIDGAFLQYCEESNLNLKAAHTDAITSWKTDSDDEHFVGIGIFEISDPKGIYNKEWKFYHCGLFHKGNQNEDEVSFFVFVLPTDFEKYQSVRNGFENWQKKRERESQEIEVIGGNPISYELDVDWDTLFLPEDLRNRITTTVDGFLKSEDVYRRLKVPWRRGIGFWGPRGCHAKGTKILMYDGSVKNVEDIVVGDLLMGPDSKPREVLQLVRGQDEMFEITPSKSKPFIVNGEHILHLQTGTQLNLPDSINISVNEYLQLSSWRRGLLTLRKPSITEFESKSVDYPYFLGLWLGDGTSSSTGITVSDNDNVTIDFLVELAKNSGMHIRTQRKDGSNCATYNLSVQVGQKNPLRQFLTKIGVLNNKHIPQSYLTSSKNDRLELLAGLIDSDGHYHIADTENPSRGYFEIMQKSERLSQDIVFLAMSLGFRATITETEKSCGDFTGLYFRIGISGDIERIPVRLDRKKPHTSIPNKSHLVYGIKDVKSLGVGDYYGFIVDRDHLYLDSNFFVMHNCGKTSCLRLLMAKYQELKPVTIQPGHSSPDELLEEAFEYAEEHSPSLLFFEDLQELVKTIDLRHFLQLLDGLQKRDGILTVVTGNDFSDLQENLKSRPRRFDRFFEFPLPDVDQCKKYLLKYFTDILKPKKIESIAKRAVKKKFTYAHLQEVYFNAVFIAIPEGREVPNEADVNLSIKQVIQEKEAADSDFIARQRDLTDDIEYESEDL
jgi:intein/homing endonuclease